MNRFRFTVKLLVIATFVLAFASIAQGQATRTWVSGVGDDVNPCSRTAPCKTWAGAISKTAAGGEIDALDPGGYGTLTITKSIIIDGTSGAGWGSTLNSGGVNGFVINDSATATPNTIKVTLRNLSINGAGASLGADAIRFIAGKELIVENVTIDNQNGDGIDVALTAVAVGNQRAYFRNVRIARVGGSGITVANTVGVGGGVSVTLDNVIVTQSGTGLTSGSKSAVVVKDCAFTNLVNHGVDVTSTSFGVNVESSLIHANTNGIRIAGGTSRIANNFITNNATAGVNITGGTISSYGDNRIDGNGTDVLGGVLGGPLGKK